MVRSLGLAAAPSGQVFVNWNKPFVWALVSEEPWRTLLAACRSLAGVSRPVARGLNVCN